MSAAPASTWAALVRPAAIVLALVGVVAAMLYYGGRLNEQEQDRRASQRRVNDLASIKEGRAEEILIYDAELLGMIVADPAAAEKATSLIFSGIDFSDERFAEVKKLTGLQNVGVNSSKNAGALLGYLQGMNSIERMWIEAAPVDDDGIRLLATLPNLKQIRFEQEMSAEQIELLGTTLPEVNVDTPFVEDEATR